MKFISTIALALLISGCAGKINLPFASVERKAACPAQSRINCAPQLSHSVLLMQKAPVVIRLSDTDGDGEPEPIFQDYIGTILHSEDRSGAYPRYCASPANDTPFLASDFEYSSIDHSGEYSGKFGRILSAKAEVDIVEAAKVAGVLSVGSEVAEAALTTSVTNARNSEVSADFNMLLVRLTVPTLNNVLWGDGGQFDNCRQFLNSNDEYRLVESMTVFRIEKATLAVVVSKAIVAEFKLSAAPESVKSESQLAALEAAIRSTVEENIETKSGEYYVISALGMVKPNRLLIAPLTN